MHNNSKLIFTGTFLPSLKSEYQRPVEMFIFAEPPSTVSLLLLEHQRLTRTKWNVPFVRFRWLSVGFISLIRSKPQRRLTGHIMSNADVAQGSAFFLELFFKTFPFFYFRKKVCCCFCRRPEVCK